LKTTIKYGRNFLSYVTLKKERKKYYLDYYLTLTLVLIRLSL